MSKVLLEMRKTQEVLLTWVGGLNCEYNLSLFKSKALIRMLLKILVRISLLTLVLVSGAIGVVGYNL